MNARIFAVADAFDAMTSDRVYRAGRSYEAAAAELRRCAGVQFDPRVVEAFCRIPRRDWEGHDLYSIGERLASVAPQSDSVSISAKGAHASHASHSAA